MSLFGSSYTRPLQKFCAWISLLAYLPVMAPLSLWAQDVAQPVAVTGSSPEASPEPVRVALPADDQPEVDTLALPTIPTEAQLALWPGAVPPLLQHGPTTDAQRAAVAAALAALATGDSSSLETLALDAAHPYAHRLAVLAAQEAYRSGRFSRALLLWHSAWETGRDVPAFKETADNALADIMGMLSKVGRTAELKTYLDLAATRGLTGTSLVKYQSSAETYARMLSHPGESFNCGPFAAARVSIASGGNPEQAESMMKTACSPVGGFSAKAVRDMAAAQTGLKLVIVRRPLGAAVPVPCVIHWKIGHYAALTQKFSDGRFTSIDPTFAENLSVTLQAVDEEGSGCILVPEDHVPADWARIPDAEADTIFGKGLANASDKDATRKSDCKTGCGSSKGMATYSFHTMLCSLLVTDTPVWHTPAVGPSFDMNLSWSQRDQSQRVGDNATTSFGSQWVHDHLSWFEFTTQAMDSNVVGVPVASVKWICPGGGSEKFVYEGTRVTSTPAIYRADAKITGLGFYDFSAKASSSAARLTWDAYRKWSIRNPDGSRLEYGHYFGNRLFLSKRIDAFGNPLTYTYNRARIDRIIDATGLYVTFKYARLSGTTWQGGLSAADVQADTGLVRVDSVSEPYGRKAVFTYDTNGRLTSSTDMVGIESKFFYDATTGVMNKLTTPYGDTTFRTSGAVDLTSAGVVRWAEATDPSGYPERIEFTSNITAPDAPLAAPSYDPLNKPTVAPAGTVPVVASGAGSTWGTGWHPWNDRDSYYWSKKAYYHSAKNADGTPSDRTKAKLTHHLMDQTTYTVTALVGSVLVPGQSRVWFAYPGQPEGERIGTSTTPTAIGRRTNDGDAITTLAYNAGGNVTQSTDPMGRTLRHSYSTDGMDLLKTELRTSLPGVLPEAWTTVSSATYDRHLPRTVTDAANLTTTITYNTRGQPYTVTDPLGLVTTYTYDATSAKLKSVVGPVPTGTADSATSRKVTLDYTGSQYGLPRTVTAGEGYAVTTTYDALNRPLIVSYPDNSTEIYTYERLNVKTVTDRANRLSTYWYNPRGQISQSQDPLGRLTTYDWCLCGGLQKLTAPGGAVTTWEYDHASRMMARVMPDNSRYTYGYDSALGLLNSITPPSGYGRTRTVAYNKDGSVWRTTAPYTAYTYDPVYGRPTDITDDTGTTRIAYHPPGTPFAHQPASVDGPLAGDIDKFSYTYDTFGRPLATTLGATTLGTLAYDTLARLKTLTTPLGVETPTYVTGTDRVGSVAGPGPISTGYTFEPLAQALRLKSIAYNNAAGALDRHDYTYAADYTLSDWKQTRSPADAANTRTLRATHDDVGRLTALGTVSGPTVTPLESYAYDQADNILSKTTPAGAYTFTPNTANQVTSATGRGLVTVSGTVSEPATITVNGTAAPLVKDRWTGTVRGGAAPRVDVAATDLAGNTATKSWRLAAIPAVTFRYDLDGNLDDDGLRSYTWDAAGRLTSVTVKPGVNWDGLTPGTTTWTYNAAGQRVSETVNGAATRRWVWAPGAATPTAELNAAGTTVVKRHFAAGEQRLASTAPGAPTVTDAAGTAWAHFLYTRDHLGSVREVLNKDGAIVARYDFDAYGRRTTYGAAPLYGYTADFGFTGHHTHPATGLVLTLYRAYDPETGRWLSRDPIWENGGMNLYGYVGGSPLMAVDPWGLANILIVYDSSDSMFKSWANDLKSKIERGEKTCMGSSVPYSAANDSINLIPVQTSGNLSSVERYSDVSYMATMGHGWAGGKVAYGGDGTQFYFDELARAPNTPSSKFLGKISESFPMPKFNSGAIGEAYHCNAARDDDRSPSTDGINTISGLTKRSGIPWKGSYHPVGNKWNANGVSSPRIVPGTVVGF